ncbi:hypothetical protein D3C73_1073170 [compost metagenome]
MLAQAGKRIAQFLHVIRQRVLLGQLDDDAGGRQRAILKQLLRHIAAPQRPIVDQRRSGQVQEQLAGRFVAVKPLGAGPKAGQFQLRVQAPAPGFGKERVRKVQGGVGGAAYQAFVPVDAGVGQVNHRLVAGPK